MSDETPVPLEPEERTPRDTEVQELRALCRRLATRMEDLERRLRRLEADR